MGSDSGRVAHPYRALVELAERERDLIANSDYEGLAETMEARSVLMAELPEVAPEDARATIAKLIELHEQNDAAMKGASLGIDVELSRLRSGRAGVRRYAPAQAAPAKRLDYSA
jgi:hypothetical protein